MAKQKIMTPADALKGLMDEYQVSVAVLAEDIQLSGSAVRQLLYGKMRVSLPVAGRLAKYFGTTIQYWTEMQGAIDFAEFKSNEKLQKEISGIAKAKKPKASAKAAAKPPKASSRTAKADKAASPRASKGAKAEGTEVKTRGRKPKADKEAPKAPKTPKPRGRKAASKSAPPEEAPPAKPKTILIKKSTPNPAPADPQETSFWPQEETSYVPQEEQTPADFPDLDSDFSEN
jgi:addiction module HigA family antidote